MENKEIPISEIKPGSIVKTNFHEHNMTVRSINETEVICNYFIGAEVYTETYNIIDIILLD